MEVAGEGGFEPVCGEFSRAILNTGSSHRDARKGTKPRPGKGQRTGQTICSRARIGTAEGRLTRTQIDRLGNRIRHGDLTEEDRRLLLAYRATFLPAYREVTQAIRDQLGLKLTGRPEKTPESIVAKLRRSPTRLATMQDIAGCRLLLTRVAEQDRVTGELRRIFPAARLHDRRRRPSHGYRAVHLIVPSGDRWVEIQIRTPLQDMWAQFVEQNGRPARHRAQVRWGSAGQGVAPRRPSARLGTDFGHGDRIGPRPDNGAG